MELPPGVSEEQLLKAVEQVVRGLKNKFRSRVAGSDDTEQQIRLFCLRALPKYKPEVGALEGFLYRAARNAMMNHVRHEYGRVSDPECRVCFDHERGRGPGHDDGQLCRKHLKWKAHNQAVSNVAHPVSMQKVADEHESRTRSEGQVESEVTGRDLSMLIDQKLHFTLREDYLKLLAGETVPKPRRERIQQAVAEILVDAGVDLP